jgi:hypothetical protein
MPALRVAATPLVRSNIVRSDQRHKYLDRGVVSLGIDLAGDRDLSTMTSNELAGKPLALRQGAALSEVWFSFACASAHRNFRVAFRQEQAALVGGDAVAAGDRRGAPLLPPIDPFHLLSALAK